MAEFKLPQISLRNTAKAPKQAFGIDKRCSSLTSLLQFMDKEFDLKLFENIPPQVAQDVAEGLAYLHQKGIAHRDLKPDNILVTNQHYAGLDEADRAKMFHDIPIKAKLTDFGESKDSFIQTQTLVESRTRGVNRGTPPVFIAPEFHSGLNVEANLEELKQADMWAFGLIIYCLLNPDKGNPYICDMKTAGMTPSIESLKQILKKKQLPRHGVKYESHRVTEWSAMEETFNACAKFDPKERPVASAVKDLLVKLSPSTSLIVTHLSVSQSTALEKADFVYAKEVNKGNRDMCESYPEPINDGTNACAFLAVAICDQLLAKKSLLSLDWNDVKVLAEEAIVTVPAKVNKLREMDQIYEPLCAYRLMKDKNIVGDCEFSEEFLDGNAVFSHSGRQEIINAISSKSKEHSSTFGIYTCTPITFVIGCHGGRLFLLDTHPIGQDLGGDGRGILVYTKDATDDCCKMLVQWIIDRLLHAGIPKTQQHSLAWVTCGK